MAREGMIPPEEFFNAVNLERILVHAKEGSVPQEQAMFLPELNSLSETADHA